MGCQVLLQGIPTQGLNPSLLRWQGVVLTAEPPGSPCSVCAPVLILLVLMTPLQPPGPASSRLPSVLLLRPPLPSQPVWGAEFSGQILSSSEHRALNWDQESRELPAGPSCCQRSGPRNPLPPLSFPPPTRPAQVPTAAWVKTPSSLAWPALLPEALECGPVFLGAQGDGEPGGEEPRAPQSQMGLVSKPGSAHHSGTWFWGSPAWEMPRDPAHAP